MIELLSPAGNFEKLKAAILYGADAVYLSGKMFGMRAFADCFETDELKQAAEYCHARGKKAYLTLNTMPHPDEYPALEKYLNDIKDIPLDAYIIADLGVLSLVKEIVPDMEIHISTQASIVSAASANMYYKLGAKRVVLSRELSFSEIADIRKNTPPELELEAFIHGAMCISYSGRCLISNHFTGRDANRGACAQPCRWVYNICEEKRPEMPIGIEQGKDGTFLFGSKDLCMIEHIPELMQSGITSFKIEGRMKSAYYAAVTANAYRIAIDNYLKDPSGYTYDPSLLTELESVSHREYDTGFFFDKPLDDAKVAKDVGYIAPKAYLADCIAYDKTTNRATFIQKNKASVGMSAQILSPGKTGVDISITDMFDKNGDPIENCPHPYMEFSMTVPFELKCGDILREK